MAMEMLYVALFCIPVFVLCWGVYAMTERWPWLGTIFDALGVVLEFLGALCG